jgi:hypothetical protein
MNSEKNKDLERTIGENRSRLLSFIRRRVGFDEEAEDILQDVLFQFFISCEAIESLEKMSDSERSEFLLSLEIESMDQSIEPNSAETKDDDR